MRRFIILVALWTVGLPSFAIAGDKDRAIEYLKLSRIDEVIAESINTYDAQLLSNAPAAERARLHNLMEETVGWDAIKDRLADIVIAVYTPQELDAYIAFMRSPVGASATAKSGEFSRQFSALLAANFQSAIQRLKSDTAQAGANR